MGPAISRTVRAVALALAALAIAGCSGNPAALSSGSAPISDRTASAFVTVKIVNYAYSPKTLVIQAGTTVKFINKDAIAHTATAFNGSFSSPPIAPGHAWKHTFKTPGKYKYYCNIHPYMHAVVKVTQ